MECEQNELTMYGNCDDENMRKQKANFNNPVDFNTTLNLKDIQMCQNML